MHSRSVHRASALSLPLMVFAVAAAIAAGLLLAPANGSTTRARLRGRAAEAGSRLRRYAEAVYDRMQQSRQIGPARRLAEPQEPSAEPLTATIGEITSATQPSQWGATS